MLLSKITAAARAFWLTEKNLFIELLGKGLINHTYKVVDRTKDIKFVLQAINTNIFHHPEDIQHNYELIQNNINGNFFLPALIETIEGKNLWQDDEKNYWRAFQFINNSYSPDVIKNSDAAYTAAYCFSKFTAALSHVQPQLLKIIIPNFHNLDFRYRQFEEAIKLDKIQRLSAVQPVIKDLRVCNHLLQTFLSFSDTQHFPLRIMHHDCKINNILFDKVSQKVICPIDMDTVMPGKFFSDLGDMIRTMVSNEDENSLDFNNINIRDDYYKATILGYLNGMKDHLSEEEKTNIHYSGLLIIYMQALRFITDYLNGDVYYKITYAEQNLHRAKNQLILLQKLERYLNETYSFPSKVSS